MSITVRPASPLLSLGRVLATSFRRPRPVRTLSPVSLVMPGVVIDAGHMARYAAVCGFTPTGQAPLTYPQVLTFALLMHYLSSPACPWPAIGTVHLANAITQHTPLRPGEPLCLALETGELRSHDKGQVFTLALRILREATGECAWQGTQTLLRIGVSEPAGPPFEAGLDTDLPWSCAGRFEAPADIGRRYAAASGDYNPIHLWPLTARLLGFRRAIAHGLWTQARALAMLQPDGLLPQASLQTVFRRPLLLPAAATLWKTGPERGQELFEVRDAAGQSAHLRALLT